MDSLAHEVTIAEHARRSIAKAASNVRWMQQIAVDEVITIKGEEFVVVKITDRRMTLRLLSHSDYWYAMMINERNQKRGEPNGNT